MYTPNTEFAGMGIEIGIGIGSEFDLTTVVERDKNQPSSDSSNDT